jgi:AcrR family transcriptional regulator
VDGSQTHEDEQSAPAHRLSPAIELAWGRPAPVRPGPRPAFSLDQVVGAAVELADEIGLQEFSMAKLAARLGSAPMSLYRYVGSKAELLVLMLDAAFGPLPPTAPPPAPWREALTFWAHALYAVYRDHAWTLEVPVRELPRTPHALAWVDFGLQTLATAGLTGEDQLGALALLDGHARNAGRLAADLRTADQDAGAGPSYSELMAPLIDAARFPALRPLLDAGLLESNETTTGEEGFAFGLERLLDGIDALIEARD